MAGVEPWTCAFHFLSFGQRSMCSVITGQHATHLLFFISPVFTPPFNSTTLLDHEEFTLWVLLGIYLFAPRVMNLWSSLLFYFPFPLCASCLTTLTSSRKASAQLMHLLGYRVGLEGRLGRAKGRYLQQSNPFCPQIILSTLLFRWQCSQLKEVPSAIVALAMLWH